MISAKGIVRVSALRLLLYLIGIVMFFPFWWMLTSSVKSSDEVLQYPPTLIPTVLHFDNYTQVFQQVAFGRYIFNSFVVATAITTVGVFFHAMSGYALARLRFPGRRPLFIGILSTMMIPFYSLLIPLFILVKDLGWINTYQGLIIPWIPNAFGIFLMRQYYMTFPAELGDAAVMDGAGPLGVFFRIALPMSGPIISALGIIYFISNWGQFIWPLVVTNTPDMSMIQVGIVQFQGQYTVSWNLMMAAAVAGCLPTLLLFFILQRRIVEGVKLSGIRG